MPLNSDNQGIFLSSDLKSLLGQFAPVLAQFLATEITEKLVATLSPYHAIPFLLLKVATTIILALLLRVFCHTTTNYYFFLAARKILMDYPQQSKMQKQRLTNVSLTRHIQEKIKV